MGNVAVPPQIWPIYRKKHGKTYGNMMTNHGSMMIHVWYHMWYHGTLSDFQLSIETILLLNCKCGWQLLINWDWQIDMDKVMTDCYLHHTY
jgi:hypothetical protein